jgi:hypothetical protein
LGLLLPESFGLFNRNLLLWGKFTLLGFVLSSITLKDKNMNPDNEFIEKFQRIYLEEFGEGISREEAYDNFFSLVDLLRIILRPIPKRTQGSENRGSVSPTIDEGRGNDRLNCNN